MRMKHLLTASALVLFMCVASPARADLIVINPNDYAPGTDLSTLFPGLTMTTWTNRPNSDGTNGRATYQPVASPVLAISNSQVPDGLSIGGQTYVMLEYEFCSRSSPSTGSIDCSAGWNVLELHFDSPTDFLSIDTRFHTDTPRIVAYDSLGNLLNLGAQGTQSDTLTIPNASGGTSEMNSTIQRESADIARVLYGGYLGSSTPVGISYRVTEPTTLGLLSVGFACAAFARARRRSPHRFRHS